MPLITLKRRKAFLIANNVLTTMKRSLTFKIILYLKCSPKFLDNNLRYGETKTDSTLINIANYIKLLEHFTYCLGVIYTHTLVDDLNLDELLWNGREFFLLYNFVDSNENGSFLGVLNGV